MPFIKIVHAIAGSGKTTRLVQETLNALDEGYKPDEIAFITFTKTGAEVIKDRVHKATNIPKKKLYGMRTIHSLAFSLGNNKYGALVEDKHLREFAEAYGYTYAREPEMVGMYSATRVNYATRSIKTLERMNSVQQFLYYDGLYRTNKDRFDEYTFEMTLPGTFISIGDVSKFMGRWEKYKRDNELIDYTDMIEKAYEEKIVLDKYKVLLLDEAQDTTPLMWKLLHVVFSQCDKWIIAGDPMQTLYKWAGADNGPLVQLNADQVDTMDVSWRCPQYVLDYVYDRIVVNMDQNVTHGVQLKAGRTRDNDERVVNYISDFSRFVAERKDEMINGKRKYMFLARDKSVLSGMVGVIAANGINAYVDGVPLWTAADKRILKYDPLKAIETWPIDKKEAAVAALESGAFHKEDTNVYLQTIHASKGDEADVVVVCPVMTRNSAIGIDIEDHHMEYYVACTRTRDELHIMVDPLGRSMKYSYPYLY